VSVPATTSVIDTRSGNFSYLDKKTAPSLHRNGKVLTRRDQDGSDAKWTGVNLVPTAMPVHDARSLNGTDRRSLARNGFELLTQAFDGSPIDFLDNDQVVSSYYPHCADIVREATGASVVMAFDHNIRSAAGKQSKQRIQGGQQVQGPAHVVHGDYTLTSAPERLRKLAEPPGSNDTWRSASAPNDSLLDPEQVQRALSGGRFQIINLWRNIADTPVARNPMALCDGRTVQLNDLVVFEIHYADRIGENYLAGTIERRTTRFCQFGFTLHHVLSQCVRRSDDTRQCTRSLEYRGALCSTARLNPANHF